MGTERSHLMTLAETTHLMTFELMRRLNASEAQWLLDFLADYLWQFGDWQCDDFHKGVAAWVKNQRHIRESSQQDSCGKESV